MTTKGGTKAQAIRDFLARRPNAVSSDVAKALKVSLRYVVSIMRAERLKRWRETRERLEQEDAEKGRK
jgi:hypothetical protein